jgi:hypothetical protein
MIIIKLDDTVLVFNKYEGTVMDIYDGQLVIYCPDFDAEYPFIVTDSANVIVLKPAIIN